jgi:hypothetical protein
MAGLYSLVDPDSLTRFPVHRMRYLYTLVANGTLTQGQARAEIEVAIGRALNAAEIADFNSIKTNLDAQVTNADKNWYLTEFEAACGEVESRNSLATEATFNNILGL